jgi:AcrR family transcriptional regulator
MAAVKRSKQTLLTRRERAKVTHWRIVKAAYEAFCQQGYAGTTMVDVAERAGVAVQTVYFVFHTKSELLSRAVSYAVMGESDPRIPEEQPWHREAVEASDLGTALHAFVSGDGEIIRRVAPLATALAGAEGDPEAAGIGSFHEEWRADGYREVLHVLLTKAPLRDALTPERATHLLLLYAGVDSYRLLVHTYGWTHAEWVDWTVQAIAEQVFGANHTRVDV